jgi:hypothetical protein
MTLQITHDAIRPPDLRFAIEDDGLVYSRYPTRANAILALGDLLRTATRRHQEAMDELSEAQDELDSIRDDVKRLRGWVAPIADGSK